MRGRSLLTGCGGQPAEVQRLLTSNHIIGQLTLTMRNSEGRAPQVWPVSLVSMMNNYRVIFRLNTHQSSSGSLDHS